MKENERNNRAEEGRWRKSARLVEQELNSLDSSLDGLLKRRLKY